MPPQAERDSSAPSRRLSTTQSAACAVVEGSGLRIGYRLCRGVSLKPEQEQPLPGADLAAGSAHKLRATQAAGCARD